MNGSRSQQPGLLFFRDDLRKLDDYSPEERGRIIWALFLEVEGEPHENFEGERDLRAAYRFLLEKLEQNEEKYISVKREKTISGLMTGIYREFERNGEKIGKEMCRDLAIQRYLQQQPVPISVSQRTPAPASGCQQKEIIEKAENQDENRAQSQSQFDGFWLAYPRKIHWSEAEKAFSKLEGNQIGQVMAALEQHKKSEAWIKDNGRYIPAPDRWLTEERWRENPPPAHGHYDAERSYCNIDEEIDAAAQLDYFRVDVGGDV